MLGGGWKVNCPSVGNICVAFRVPVECTEEHVRGKKGANSPLSCGSLHSYISQDTGVSSHSIASFFF